MKVYAVLFLFFGVYLTVCIWIFLVITDSIRKISLHGFLRAKNDIVETIDRHFTMLSENRPVPVEEVVLLCQKLNNKKLKRYFYQRFINFADRIRNKDRIKEYFEAAFPNFQDLLRTKKKLHYSEKSYRLMLLGEFRQDTEEINRYILDSLEDESFDVRTNALRALSMIGNSSYFNAGLTITCSSEKYYNTRHISEMTGSFEGNTDELKQLMKDAFYGNPDTYRYQVIVFLTETASCGSVDFILDYLRNYPENKEIVIAGLKYFCVCEVHDRAREYIADMLTVEDSEIKAVLVKLLPQYFYRDRKVIMLLLGEGFLGSRDWYVRRNSAAALVAIGLEKEELKSRMPVSDSYAREALIYAMFDAGIVSYEEMSELGGEMNEAV